MSNSHDEVVKKMSFQTQAIHGGVEADPATGAIEPSIYMANSFALPYDPSSMNWSA
ncbi:MAG TPA: cystathionine gamma-lyase, partial [Eubacterium sp.]|nr:cystathionine gamma-lyase [Eubacterium sp.]